MPMMMSRWLAQPVADGSALRWSSPSPPERARRGAPFTGWWRGGHAPAADLSWPACGEVAAIAVAVVGGSDVMQAMLQTNPASSRAIAVTMICVGLPLAIIWR